ncbi:DUF4386 domain-containing protein [Acidipropionibacterium timonense]|uniref:DUF4386 domain-containing protein n=1 Tax=Acidipropionibacterium timonense TaxID=2161818 RepID=UPI001AEBB671|nr:DUF4386 domain-containing protein [Acidipropionibacterium timonense]
MTDTRTPYRFAGVLYLVTHVTSVVAVILYGSSALDTRAALADRPSVITGALLEVVLALAIVGTGVVLYPLLRRAAPTLAASYTALRTLEASVILVGVVTILPTVARPAARGGSGVTPDVTAALHLVHDWTFLVGPGLVAPVHTAVLATLLLRHRMVPRWIPLLGLTGALVTTTHNLALLYGLMTPIAVSALPIFLWEISLAVHLIVRGLHGG